MAGVDSQEDDGPAKIELTCSTPNGINRARPAFGMLAVCIFQEALRIRRHQTHPDWNYTLDPRT